MAKIKQTKVRCPYCGELFDQDQIERHIADKHAKPAVVARIGRVLAAHPVLPEVEAILA